MATHTRRHTPVGLAATGVAWALPTTVIVSMICPPALLALPAAGAVMAGRAAGRRHTRRAQAAQDADDMAANWARWSKLDPTSERGY